MDSDFSLQDLIGLIFQNFGFVMFIGAALFGGLFSSMRKGSKRNPMPPFGGGTLFGEQDYEPDKQPSAERRSRAESEDGNNVYEEDEYESPPFIPVQPVSSSKATVAQQRASVTADFGSDAEGSIHSNSVSADQQAESALYSDASSAVNTNLNPVVQGVIWSEILGPPRAKKPYRR